MRLGKRCPAFQNNGIAVFGLVEALEYSGDPVVFLDVDRRNPDLGRRGLNELQLRVGRLMQLHRIFQARDSGHSSGSMPKSKRVAGLSEALSAGITSIWHRASSIPSSARVPGL